MIEHDEYILDYQQKLMVRYPHDLFQHFVNFKGYENEYHDREIDLAQFHQQGGIWVYEFKKSNHDAGKKKSLGQLSNVGVHLRHVYGQSTDLQFYYVGGVLREYLVYHVDLKKRKPFDELLGLERVVFGG